MGDKRGGRNREDEVETVGFHRRCGLICAKMPAADRPVK
jgi:hypothetical protein